KTEDIHTIGIVVQCGALALPKWETWNLYRWFVSADYALYIIFFDIDLGDDLVHIVVFFVMYDRKRRGEGSIFFQQEKTVVVMLVTVDQVNGFVVVVIVVVFEMILYGLVVFYSLEEWNKIIPFWYKQLGYGSTT